ncbi:hypothetical protein TNCV_2264471 [Trichonephila clavipes]|nr:hypothetical protein TNCV_2264471 [Trichonephila clavipes]
MARIGQQKRCCVPSGQLQTTHVYSDSPETLGGSNCNIRKQRLSLYYNGDSIETWRIAGDRAKLASFLATTLATWRLVERCKS